MKFTFWFEGLLLASAASVHAQGDGSETDPVYPSPESSGIGFEGGFEKAKAFVSKLSIDDKARLVTGDTGPCTGNIGPVSGSTTFRGLCLLDGPAGVRQAVNVSTFPAGISVGASWDRSLAYERGAQMAAEFKGKGGHIALGPVVGPLGKNALGGRNWEGFSVDPYLAGALVQDTVAGIQDAGVQACTKHFIGNEQETQRTGSPGALGLLDAVSSNIDDVSMHELYLWPFANAVRAGTSSIMCSYNRLNHTYGCESSKVLNGLLKTELGFQGYVMSDWGAQHSGIYTANAGMDMAMPGGTLIVTSEPTYWRDHLADAVRNGSVTEARLNDMAVRVMTPYFQLNQDSASYPFVDSTNGQPSLFLGQNSTVTNSLVGGTSGRNVQADHATLIRQLGAAGTVLLKNTNNVLPLNKPRSIGVYANDAGPKLGDIQQTLDYYFGTLPIGGGSGTGHLPYVIDPLAAITAQAKNDGSNVTSYLDNYSIATGVVGPGTFFGLNITKAPEICLVFLKQWSTEGTDLTTLSTEYSGDAVVNKIASICSNTVVVINGPGPNTMPWATNPNVTGILAQHFPGQELGNAIVDVLYGKANPSGRLPYTVALKQDDYPSKPVTTFPYEDNFREKLLIDYKYFDAKNLQVQYPFGFGLSYTSFSLTNLQTFPGQDISPTPGPSKVEPGGSPDLWNTLVAFEFTVTNTGKVAGAAVPQLYLSLGPNAPAGHPVRQLRSFDKVSLAPGASRKINFALTRRDVSYWDAGKQQWVVPAGQMTASIGFHSRSLLLNTTFTLV